MGYPSSAAPNIIFQIMADFTIADGKNVVLGTTTGTQVGTADDQKLALWGATPVTQPAEVTAPSGGNVIDGEARDAIVAIIALLKSIGAMNPGGA